MGYLDLMVKVERWINILNSMGASSSGKDTVKVAASATTTKDDLDSSSSSTESEQQQRTYAERLANSPKKTQNTTRCAVCEGYHATERCGILAKMDPDGKVKKLSEKKLCFSCLAPGHSARVCQSEKPFCIVCHKSHQTILHGRTYPTPAPRLSANARPFKPNNNNNNDQTKRQIQPPTNKAATPNVGTGSAPAPTQTDTPAL